MSLVCRTCTRVNPPEALFCYHDGAALVGGVGQGGPIAVGAQPFLSPFVFPSGRSCGNFDELVLACEAEWEAAQELLYQGYLESFLGGDILEPNTHIGLVGRPAISARGSDARIELKIQTRLPSQIADGVGSHHDLERRITVDAVRGGNQLLCHHRPQRQRER